MNFWEWLQYTAWDISGRLGDKDAASHAQALWDVTHATSGMDKQINDAINAYKIKHTGILGVLDTFGTNFVNVFKNLPWIVVGIGVIIVLVMVFPYIKKK